MKFSLTLAFVFARDLTKLADLANLAQIIVLFILLQYPFIPL